jgi:hypothetical protein
MKKAMIQPCEQHRLNEFEDNHRRPTCLQSTMSHPRLSAACAQCKAHPNGHMCQQLTSRKAALAYGFLLEYFHLILGGFTLQETILNRVHLHLYLAKPDTGSAAVHTKKNTRMPSHQVSSPRLLFACVLMHRGAHLAGRPRHVMAEIIVIRSEGLANQPV